MLAAGLVRFAAVAAVAASAGAVLLAAAAFAVTGGVGLGLFAVARHGAFLVGFWGCGR